MLRDGSSSDVETWSGSGAEDSTHQQQCDRVHRTLKRIVKASGALDAQECAALREAQKLMLWRAHGCASFVEYMERELGYTARAAIDRLRVAKAIGDVPELGEALNQGGLSFSGARELSRVITPETQAEWIGAAQEKQNVREIEALVSGHKPGDRPTDAPDPALRTKVLRHEVKMSVADLERRARKMFARQRGSSVDDSDFMEACFKALLDQCEEEGCAKEAARAAVAVPVEERAPGAAMSASAAAVIGSPALTEAEIERVVAPRYQVAVTVCGECRSRWQHGVGGTTLLTPPELERALCDSVDIGSIDDECDGSVVRRRPSCGVVRRAAAPPLPGGCCACAQVRANYRRGRRSSSTCSAVRIDSSISR